MVKIDILNKSRLSCSNTLNRNQNASDKDDFLAKLDARSRNGREKHLEKGSNVDHKNLKLHTDQKSFNFDVLLENNDTQECSAGGIKKETTKRSDLFEDKEEHNCNFDIGVEGNDSAAFSYHGASTVMPVLNFVINESSVNTLNSNGLQFIENLHQMIDKALVQYSSRSDQLWKFKYIDPAANDLILSVKKINKDDIIVNITSSKLDEKCLKIIVDQLHNRLRHKGWTSRGDIETDIDTQDLYSNNNRHK
jgi:hypothetical protein